MARAKFTLKRTSDLSNVSNGAVVPMQTADLDEAYVWGNSGIGNGYIQVPSGYDYIRMSCGARSQSAGNASGVYSYFRKQPGGSAETSGFHGNCVQEFTRLGSTRTYSFMSCTAQSALMPCSVNDVFGSFYGFDSTIMNDLECSFGDTFFSGELISADEVHAALIGFSADWSPSPAPSAGTWFKLEFDEEVFDTIGAADVGANPGQLTVPTGATHVRLSGNIRGQNYTAADHDVALIATKNGDTPGSVVPTASDWMNTYDYFSPSVSPAPLYSMTGHRRYENSAAGLTGCNARSPLLPVSDGDYFELWARASNASIVATIQNHWSWFQMEAFSL